MALPNVAKSNEFRAAAAAALSLILLILGTGLGLSAVSPWHNAGIGAATFGITTILWVTLTQLLASGPCHQKMFAMWASSSRNVLV